MLKKIFCLIALSIMSSTTWANETEHQSSEHHASNVENPHSFGVFLGGVQTEHHSYASYGLEYAYEFNHKWAASIAWEKVDGAHHGDGIETVVASVLYSPMDKVWLGAGYGKESIHGSHSDKEDLYRISATYDFFIDDFKIAPLVAFDYADGTKSAVFGVNFSITF